MQKLKTQTPKEGEDSETWESPPPPLLKRKAKDTPNVGVVEQEDLTSQEPKRKKRLKVSVKQTLIEESPTESSHEKFPMVDIEDDAKITLLLP